VNICHFRQCSGTQRKKETLDLLSSKLFHELCTNADEQQWKIGHDVKTFVVLPIFFSA